MPRDEAYHFMVLGRELERIDMVGRLLAIRHDEMWPSSGPAAALRAAAEADIAQERKKAVNDLKNEIGGIAVDIAGKVVEREINETDHKALIDEFIRNVGDAS